MGAQLRSKGEHSGNWQQPIVQHGCVYCVCSADVAGIHHRGLLHDPCVSVWSTPCESRHALTAIAPLHDWHVPLSTCPLPLTTCKLQQYPFCCALITMTVLPCACNTTVGYAMHAEPHQGCTLPVQKASSLPAAFRQGSGWLHRIEPCWAQLSPPPAAVEPPAGSCACTCCVVDKKCSVQVGRYLPCD